MIHKFTVLLAVVSYYKTARIQHNITSQHPPLALLRHHGKPLPHVYSTVGGAEGGEVNSGLCSLQQQLMELNPSHMSTALLGGQREGK
jgi:hypothetical protein